MKPLSWSELDLYLTDNKEWYKRYIMGQKPPDTIYTQRGKHLHEFMEGKNHDAVTSIAHGGCYTEEEVLANQKCIEFLDIWSDETDEQEKEVRVDIDGVPTVSYWDAYSKAREGRTAVIKEWKTGGKVWSTARVNKHGQLPFYALQHQSLFDAPAVVTLASASWKEPRRSTAFSITPSQTGLDHMRAMIRNTWKDMTKRGLLERRKSTRV